MHVAAVIFKGFLIGIWALGIVLAPYRVGKVREPLTAGQAASSIIVGCLLIAGLITLWGR